MSKRQVTKERLRNLLSCAEVWAPEGPVVVSTQEQQLQNNCIRDLSQDLTQALAMLVQWQNLANGSTLERASHAARVSKWLAGEP